MEKAVTRREERWCADVMTMFLTEGAPTPKKIANFLINCSKEWRDEMMDWADKNPPKECVMARFAFYKLIMEKAK